MGRWARRSYADRFPCRNPIEFVAGANPILIRDRFRNRHLEFARHLSHHPYFSKDYFLVKWYVANRSLGSPQKAQANEHALSLIAGREQPTSCGASIQRLERQRQLVVSRGRWRFAVIALKSIAGAESREQLRHVVLNAEAVPGGHQPEQFEVGRGGTSAIDAVAKLLIRDKHSFAFHSPPVKRYEAQTCSLGRRLLLRFGWCSTAL